MPLLYIPPEFDCDYVFTDGKYAGLVVPIKLDAEVICRVSFQLTTDEKRFLVARIFCDNWTANQWARTLVETCIQKVLDGGQVQEIETTDYVLQRRMSATEVIGVVFHQRPDVVGITSIAKQFFQLLNETLGVASMTAI